MRTYGIGIIGWGFMGQTHALAIRTLPLFYAGAGFRAEIRCICTRREEVARQAAADMGADWTCDYRELLKRDDIDVVSVCTPNAQHEQMALDVLAANKHLYIDKPLTVTGEEARRVAEAAQNAQVFTKVAFNLRHFPATMRLKELADEGALGEITQFSARYLHSGSIDPDRPMGWKQGLEGGVLLDLGSHALDLLTWIAGYPQEAMCAFRTLYPSRPTREGGVETRLSEDHALMTLRLPGGTLGTVEASKIAAGALDEMTLEVRGTRGAAIFETMRPNYLRWFDQSRPEKPLGGERGFVDIECAARYPAPGGKFLPGKNAIGWDRAHIDCYFDLLNCIHHGRRPQSTVEEAARLQCLMDSLARSAREGARWVRA